MEKSETRYVFATADELKDVAPEEYADAFWPARGGELARPWVRVESGGRRELMEFPMDERAVELIAAEPHFNKKEYAEALGAFLGIAKAYPRCYQALSLAGSCYYFTGEHKKALKLYRKAIKVNPYDHRLYLYEGDALIRLGRARQARAAYVRGLALKPGHWSLMKNVKRLAGELGVKVHDERFVPRSFARREGDDVRIYISASEDSAAHWITYAACKAVWIGEPDHRKAMMGDAEHNWTNQEEWECFVNLLGVYMDRDDEVRAEPALDRLVRVLEDDLLDSFILYEIGSRILPNIILTVPDEQREEMERYVAKYVVMPAGD
ncbi:MAG: tetratricopeptide repeat protein [Acidobacteriota bacterium]